MALNQSGARQPFISNNSITILSDHHHPIIHFSCVLDAITPLSMVIQWFIEHISGVGHTMMLLSHSPGRVYKEYATRDCISNPLS